MTSRQRLWLYPEYDENGDLNLTGNLNVPNDTTVAGNLVVTGTVTAAGTQDGGGNVFFPASIGITDNITDENGLELIKLVNTAVAVDEITVTNAAANGIPSIAATGDDTDIDILIKGKGTGAVQLGQATSLGVQHMADQPVLDSSGNELVKFSKTASAVNEVTVTNAATADGPKLSATGGDSVINLVLAGKSTGGVLARSTFGQLRAATVDATAGAMTITAAQFLGGMILRDPNGAARSDVLPAGTAIADALGGKVAVGDSVECMIVNNADAAETITITSPGASIVLKGRATQQTITQNHTGTVVLICSTATVDSEVFDAYVIGN